MTKKAKNQLCIMNTRISLVLSLSIVLSACGGGGSGGGSDEPSDSFDAEESSTGFPESENDTDTDADEAVPGSNQPEGDVDEDDDSDTVEEDTEADGTPPTDGSGDDISDNTTGDFSLPLIIASEGAPAPGVPGESIDRLSPSTFQVNDSGNVMFSGRLSLLGDELLWGGNMASPVLLIEPGMEVPGFPANIRLEEFDPQDAHLSNDGTVAAIASLGGARSVNVVLLQSESGMSPVFQSDTPLETGSQSMSFSGYTAVRHANDAVAVLANEEFLSRSLIMTRGGQDQFIAPDANNGSAEQRLLAPLQPDGCRILVDNPGTSSFDLVNFDVRNDGAVVFNAMVFVEPGAEENVAVCPDRFRIVTNSNFVPEQIAGNGFSSVVIYRDNNYTRIVSRGDPVPGMNNAVFTDVSFTRILDNGSILVVAELNDITVRGEERQSYWIFSENEDPRLVFLEGETTDSDILNLQYTISVGNAFGFGGFDQLDVNSPGTSLLVDRFENNAGDTVTWMIAGPAHPGQPYPDLDATGASPMQPVLVTGYPSPAGFPDSSFWSDVGEVSLLPGGGGVFSGTILDSDPDSGTPSTSRLWRFDSNRQISQVFPGEVTITVNEILRVINIPTAGWVTVGDVGIVFLDSSSSDERLIFLPFDL